MTDTHPAAHAYSTSPPQLPSQPQSASHAHYTRRPSSLASNSPVLSVRDSVHGSAGSRDRDRDWDRRDDRERVRDRQRESAREVDRRGEREVQRGIIDWRTQPASPPNPTPSRMSLSALVNSPPGSPPTLTHSGLTFARSPSFSPPPSARSRSNLPPQSAYLPQTYSSYPPHRDGYNRSQGYLPPLSSASTHASHNRRGSFGTDSAPIASPSTGLHAGASMNGSRAGAVSPSMVTSTSLDYAPADSSQIFYHTGQPPSFPQHPPSARGSSRRGHDIAPAADGALRLEYDVERRERNGHRNRDGHAYSRDSGRRHASRGSASLHDPSIPLSYDPSPPTVSASTRLGTHPDAREPLPATPALSRNGYGGNDVYERAHSAEHPRTYPEDNLPRTYSERNRKSVDVVTGAENISYRLSDRLLGAEDVWEEALKGYQMKREREVAEIMAVDPSKLPPTRHKPGPVPKKSKKSTPLLSTTPNIPDGQQFDESGYPLSNPSVSVKDDEPKPKKPRGWPADHPTRIAQRLAKEAAIAAGTLPPPGSKKRVTKKNKAGGLGSAAVEDELLGLAEGEGRSSPMPASVDEFMDQNGDDDEIDGVDARNGEDLGPDSIVYPCGLTRAELIARIEAHGVEGLTEADVKAVQDEMWVRKKEREGGAGHRKDGTLKRKPGPSKGWKQLRGEAAPKRTKYKGSSAMGGEEDRSEFEYEMDGSSIIGDEEGHYNYDGTSIRGEAGRPRLGAGGGGSSELGAEADIAALLDDGHSAPGAEVPKPKNKGGWPKGKKRRKIDPALAEESRPDTDDDRSILGAPGLLGEEEFANERRSSIVDEDIPGVKKAKTTRAKEPGVGKGRWIRPLKPKELLTAPGVELDGSGIPVEDLLPGPNGQSLYANGANPAYASGMGELPFSEVDANQETSYQPNREDPRGVSEEEAKIRYGLVEDLQKVAWSNIVRDVPRVYRVYQGYDSVAKQDKSRVIQACLRNAFLQRQMKPSYKTPARITKDAQMKAKRVMKEMLTFWRKNEKDELIARRKAEKEALERAKAEEEAREARRQSRKLNFLLTQTELYSHFIGKKIKTAEAERPDDESGAAAGEKAVTVGEKEKEAHDELGLDDSGEPLPDIDYDDDDEENLRRHAARGAQAAMRAARDKARAFDEARQNKDEQLQNLDLDGDELNFQNPSLGADAIVVTQPKMLMAQLKEYQLKGLTWLGNLYEQGINGILADEMGLGKTIQSISLLAYLAEHHNLWGPFLVIAPASTLHNWQQELARFVPRLKAIPYWGSPKDRETLRGVWCKKNMTFDADSPFHIVVTSYQLGVLDEKYLQQVKWQYMILDEAQAIKSSTSARWKSLLSLPCRNRLLLTGTPIQNSMHELWALLHFIMPSLFDSHEEFSEWFSKDIENAAGGGTGTLKPEQLRRLHMILKPFMLRRVKKHVQKELGDKIEIDVLVDLSQRQRAIYKALRQRVSISDLIAQANNLNDTNGTKNLMNLVMQFRKVCNHPDLFERADVVSPFMFGTFSQSNLSRESDGMYLPDSAKNAIQPKLPRLLWTDHISRPSETSSVGGKEWVLRNVCNIWNPEWVGMRMKEDEKRDEGWGFLRLKQWKAGDVSRRARSHPLVQVIDEANEDKSRVERGMYDLDNTFAASSADSFKLAPRLPCAHSPGLPALRDITNTSWTKSFLSRSEARFGLEQAVAPRIKPIIHDRSYINTQTRLASDPITQAALYGLAPSEINDSSAFSRLQNLIPDLPPTGLLSASPASQLGGPRMLVPPIKRLVVDSAKLARLDELLRELKDGGHRVLLYFQMTKMMDLVEEYLIYRQYKYLRLDGGSAIGDRRDMVTSWQTNPEIFVFCLSTRAGGLGINLTAADTVVFYDHDWNPSNDAQAMDRAHRVGQTKQVTVYRLIARGTIEERILKLARAKKDVQDIVVGTKSLTDVAKPSEIVSLFMDDEELAESVAKRKQAEAHGYVAPTIAPARAKSAFGDGLGNTGDDDEDDFFSMSKQPANNEDEDFGDETGPGGGGNSAGGGGGASGKDSKGKGKASGSGTPKKKSSGGSKRKAPATDGDAADKPATPKKKKVKIALGPDGLPI